MRRKGLLNNIVINFRWDKKGFKLIEKRARKHGMPKEAYLRYCVTKESEE